MREYSIHTPDQLARAIRDRRKSRNKTQATAGIGVGVLPKTVSAMESQPGRSSIDTLFKLMAALDLEMVLRPKEAGSRNESQSPRPEW